MSPARRALLRLEAAKLARATVTRVATLAAVALVAATSLGGYAAAVRAPGTGTGRKAAAMLQAPGWAGLTGLGATSIGVTTLLVVGVVAAWSVGRELTDGTVVGLFALPVGTGEVARAKLVVVLAWAGALAVLQAALVATGGVLLGLPAAGAPGCAVTLAAVGALLGAAALPVTWAATAGRGYLAGIAATLGLVVMTNVAAGFGLGGAIPWAVPVLWAMPGADVAPWALAQPGMAAVAGAWACCRAWSRLELGAR